MNYPWPRDEKQWTVDVYKAQLREARAEVERLKSDKEWLAAGWAETKRVLEAEVERLTAKVAALDDYVNPAEVERLRDMVGISDRRAVVAESEVERLRADAEGHRICEENMDAEVERLQRLVAAYEDLELVKEIERLRTERDDARVQRDTALTTLELSQAEVERLRAFVEQQAELGRQ